MSILLSNIDRQHFTDREPWTPYWSDCFKPFVNPYLEIGLQRPNLVICYGDSWTWGDSLGNSSASKGIDDFEFRSKNIYGYHLSQELDADFVNCAVPGIFNYWIHDRLDILIKHDIDRLSSRYKKIYIIVTLTEIGRDFEFENYINDFKNFYNFTASSGNDILVNAEKFDFVNIKRIQTQLPANCRLIVGRNFTYTYPENLNIVDHLLPLSWCELLFQSQNFEVVNDVPLVSFGLDNFDNFIKSNGLDSEDYKQWMVGYIMPKVKKQIDLLNQSIYNYKKASKHPTPDGHKMWANYILNYINRLEQ